MDASDIEEKALKNLSGFVDNLNNDQIKLDINDLAACFCSVCSLIVIMNAKIKRLENLLKKSPRT